MIDVFAQLQIFRDDIITFFEPADPILIDEFEYQNEVILPQDFKIFLGKSNGLEILSTSIYGLGNKKEDLFELYRREHTLAKIPMPKSVIPFSPDGRANFYCFDSNTMYNGSCKIIFWTPNYSYTNNDGPEVCNESFCEWVKEVVIEWTKEDNDDVLK